MQSPELKVLSENTKIILSDTSHHGDIYKAVHALYDIFSVATGIVSGDLNDEPIYLSSGKAVSPVQAVHCLLEFKRTAVFIRGIYKAILHLQQKFANTTLHILYAGCGPYATLLTPLTAMFTADEIKFTLLDVNQHSLNAALRLYNHLGLNAYINKAVLADAAVYQIESHDLIHMAISETMQQALRREPQVAIMLNLIPQLPPEGLFIPEEISITAKLTSARNEMLSFATAGLHPERMELGSVYTIGRNNAAQHKTVNFDVPLDTGAFADVTLFTDITVFGNEVLTAYNCSLNLPVRICRTEMANGKQLSLTYQMTDKPHFAWQIS